MYCFLILNVKFDNEDEFSMFMLDILCFHETHIFFKKNNYFMLFSLHEIGAEPFTSIQRKHWLHKLHHIIQI